MPEKDFFARKILTATAIVVLFVFSVLILIYARTFFLLLFGGVLLGVFLRAISSWLSKKVKFLKPGISLAIVVVFLLGLTGLAIVLIAPTIGEQVNELRATLPKSLAELQNWMEGFEIGRTALEQVRQGLDQMMEGEGAPIEEAAGILSSTLGVVADVLIIFVIGIFFAADPYLYKNGIVSLFPPKNRERISEVIHKCYKFLALWLMGKFLAMAIVGILSGVGLAILGVPMAIGLAFIVFLLDFIPSIGPIIAAIPAMLVAFMISPMYALYVAILYFVIQSIEAYILVPIIYKKTISISPVMTLMSIVFFGIIDGPLRVILASPLVAVLKVLVSELYIHDYLEDKKGFLTN
ncbi:MAG: AI-2E family transporter [Cytophagaceae bacterium]